MLKDKNNESTASVNDKESSEPKKVLKEFKTIETIDFGDPTGFVCDPNTGICGPVNPKKEGKQ